jgi:hypothetical protein
MAIGVLGEAIASADGLDEIRQDRSAGRDVGLVDGPVRKVVKKRAAL